MGLGPIEVMVIEFPGSKFAGGIVAEIERLVANETISVIDGVLVRKDPDGVVTFVEFDDIGGDDDAAQLAGVLDQVEALISDEDIDEWAQGLAPGDSEAILVFEHRWAKGLRDAVVNSGGVLAENFRIPGEVVDELMDDLAAMPDSEETPQ